MPSSKAVVLAYDEASLTAPKIVAKGKGEVAQKIIAKAKEYDIALFKNPQLASSLLELEIEQEIPPKLYQAVAEVFVWLMKNEKSLL